MRLDSNKHPAARRAGYTLMEVALAIGLVGLAAAALYAGMMYTAQLSAITREELRATQIMVEKLDTLRLYTWQEIGAPFDPDDPDDPLDPFDPEDPHTAEDEAEPFVLPASFTAPFTPGSTNADELIYHGTLTLTNAPLTEDYAGQLLLVKVGLRWTNAAGRVQQREMQTLFAKYGMQNNVRR